MNCGSALLTPAARLVLSKSVATTTVSTPQPKRNRGNLVSFAPFRRRNNAECSTIMPPCRLAQQQNCETHFIAANDEGQAVPGGKPEIVVPLAGQFSPQQKASTQNQP
jgi:hypothetical protein